MNRALMDYGYVGDLSVKDGRYFPSKAPLLSFAAVPIYAALRVLGGGYRYAVGELPLVYFARLFLTVLPTLLMLPYLQRFLRAYVDEPIADGMTVTYALGSLALSYSLLFMSHQTAAVLAFASFLSLWRTLRGDGHRVHQRPRPPRRRPLWRGRDSFEHRRSARQNPPRFVRAGFGRGGGRAVRDRPDALSMGVLRPSAAHRLPLPGRRCLPAVAHRRLSRNPLSRGARLPAVILLPV